MTNLQHWRTHQTKYWDQVAPQYDSLYSTAWSRAENQQLIEQLRQLQCLQPNSKVLDLGCGTGLGYELCSQAISNNLQYFGLDISAEMIAICKQKWTSGQFLVGTMGDLSAFDSLCATIVESTSPRSLRYNASVKIKLYRLIISTNKFHHATPYSPVCAT